MKWQILEKSKKPKNDIKEIADILLKNRGIASKKEKQEFIKPLNPYDLSLTDLGIDKNNIKKVIKRLNQAKEKKERIMIFGDYDCDGVCATAILWEAMYKQGYDVLPYIPNRFEEGYGIKKTSFKTDSFKKINPSLIITVDNGIVAGEAISEANRLGVDVVVIDHHQKSGDILVSEFVLHSDLVCGSALSWFFTKELGVTEGLELALLGTISDQMVLTGVNRSLVKYGLNEINKTKRVGIKAILKESGIEKVGVYEIGFIIAPRINAMGRMSHALDSLRLLCTKDKNKASELAEVISQANKERQKVVDDVLSKVEKEIKDNLVVTISGDYHEGVIGLAAGKITEKLYRPAIVFSVKEGVAKASARSIPGFNIIEAIKKTNLILEGGGHPMAAGFSIETKNIDIFSKKINQIAKRQIKKEDLEKVLKVDAIISEEVVSDELMKVLKEIEPFGNGNYPPVFAIKDLVIVSQKAIGQESKHLKLKLQKNNKIFDAVWFNYFKNFDPKTVKADFAFTVEENFWNGISSIQLRVRDASV